MVTAQPTLDLVVSETRLVAARSAVVAVFVEMMVSVMWTVETLNLFEVEVGFVWMWWRRQDAAVRMRLADLVMWQRSDQSLTWKTSGAPYRRLGASSWLSGLNGWRRGQKLSVKCAS